MKILYLYQYIPSYHFDHYLHTDEAIAWGKVSGVETRGYGLNLEQGYPEFAIPYNKNKTFEDIKKEFDFDIIICGTKDRCFEYYCPPYFGKGEIRKGCWLPNDFSIWNKTPKICFDEDYHYEDNDDWFFENNIDLIVQRHFSNVERGNNRKQIKHVWLPFSVDTSIFNPDSNIKRVEKLCCAATLSGTFYIHRKKVCDILQPTHLLVNLGNEGKVNNIYPSILQKYISHINCSGLKDITAAKIFEITASGSVLFTNESEKYGIQYLFPKDSYCTYREDYSDVIDKARMIVQDKDYRKETTDKALKCILERHTHEIRTQELLTIIKEEFDI